MKKMFFAVILAHVLLFSESMCGVRTIRVPVELTETAVNRFLQKQYQEGGIPTNIPFNIGGVSGILNLSLPYVIFQTNSATVRLEIHITSTVGNYDVVINPTIGIDPGNINTAQVTAFLTNVPVLIQALPSIPQQVKDAIIQHYNNLNLVVYPSRLLNLVDNTWLRERSMTASLVWIGWEVLPGVLRLKPGATINSVIPRMDAAMNHYQTTSDLILRPNLQVKVEEITITYLGSSQAWHYTPARLLTKGVGNAIDIGSIPILPPTHGYIAEIRYSIPNSSGGILTFYYRKYQGIYANTGNYYGSTGSIN
jgi:hypothetical protein